MMLLKARNTTNSLDIAKMLLEKGADPNAQSNFVDHAFYGSDSDDSGSTPQSVSVLDEAKKMLRRREEEARKAGKAIEETMKMLKHREEKVNEESKKIKKIVQLLEQYADKKGF